MVKYLTEDIILLIGQEVDVSSTTAVHDHDNRHYIPGDCTKLGFKGSVTLSRVGANQRNSMAYSCRNDEPVIPSPFQLLVQAPDQQTASSDQSNQDNENDAPCNDPLTTRVIADIGRERTETNSFGIVDVQLQETHKRSDNVVVILGVWWLSDDTRTRHFGRVKNLLEKDMCQSQMGVKG